MITLHTIVKNEEKFIKAALVSALSSNEVKRALVWDTGSTDDTVGRILSINDKRIEFQQKGKVDRKGLVYLRKEQLEMTKTPWFMLLDGDEVWPEKNLRKLISAMKRCNKETIALVNRTRNAIGDVYHYLPESEGHYQIGRWSGHLNIRAIRNLPGLTIKGVYPSEWYELAGEKIQDYPSCLLNQESPGRTARRLLNRHQDFCLRFVDTWYLHVTHLKRSGNWLSELSTIDRLKKHKWLYRPKLKWNKLLKMEKPDLPKLLQNICP